MVAGGCILRCPRCHIEVHRTSWDDPRRGTASLEDEIERACVRHLRVHHPRRFRWYKRTGWRWLVRGRDGSPAVA